jgi:hypothetical protein
VSLQASEHDPALEADQTADDETRSALRQAVERVWLRVIHPWDVPDPNHPLSRYHQAGWLRKLLQACLPFKVSRVHLYEAQDRYQWLRGMLELYGRQDGEADSNDGIDPEERRRTVEQSLTTLHQVRWLLTRRQGDLNHLWRELTRVHMMLAERVMPEWRLTAQVNLCREDAHRLGVSTVPAVNEMLQRLAEVTDESAPDRKRICRGLNALLERFLSIRTGRIHQQFVNMRTYSLAFVFLLFVGFAMFDNATIFFEGEQDADRIAALEQSYERRWGEPTAPSADAPQALPAVASALPAPAWREALGDARSLFDGLRAAVGRTLASNLLAFIFLSGLAGGLFSVVMRVRQADLVPGQDAYTTLYVLTRPIVGALAGAVLILLASGGLAALPDPLGTTLELGAQGPQLFGVTFLAAFSERLVFPALDFGKGASSD